MKRVATLALVIVGALASPMVFAQPCLTAKPAPACRSCFITEFGYGYKVTPAFNQRATQMIGDSVTFASEWELAGRNLLASEVGYLYNLNPQYGLGFTHFTGWNIGNSLRGGLKLRVRRWITTRTSLDVSCGAILWAIDQGGFEDPSLIGGASVTFSEWESVNLLVEIVQTKPTDNTYDYGDGLLRRNISPRQRDVGVYLGYKASSKPGLFLNVGGVAVAGAVLAYVGAVMAGAN